MIYKKFIPNTLLGRSLIIVFIPLITLVGVTVLVFYQTSWNIISKRLAQSVVADINVVVKLIDQDLKFEAIRIAKKDAELAFGANISNIGNKISYDCLFKTFDRGYESVYAIC